jgi:Ca2+-binding EF-hand superfamily protein
LEESEIVEIGQLFKQYDKNGDGVLNLDELRNGTISCNYLYSLALNLPVNNDNLVELAELIKGMDIDDNGTINYTGISNINIQEFVAACIDKSIYLK